MNEAYRPTIKSLIDKSLGLASLILTILIFTAFEPLLPDPAFDGSWRYAVAAAAARSMPFGRDFVFTFGPLGMLYSGFRLPSQDALYLGLHTLLSAGLFAGFLLSSRPARRPALILLPVVVAASVTPDAIFFVLPLSLVTGCTRRNLSPVTRGTVVVLVAACDGLLPLIKGTMSLPVGACTVIATGLLARERSAWALVVPSVTVVTFLSAWSGVGQHLTDIPIYLSTQSEIAAGYTDAMSVFGAVSGVAIFVAFAVAIVVPWAAGAMPGQRIAIATATTLVAFVAFKAGFVRDDGHSLISASALSLLGLLLFVQASPGLSVLGLALGVAGWACVAHADMDISPRAIASRFTDALSESIHSIRDRVRHPGRTFAPFEQRRAEIADLFERPEDDGFYDVYPTGQTPLLASGLPWAPRPIIQSYSAYTPALSAMNAAHLTGSDAPDNVMFDVMSLDNRYPSLDDGLSWLALLSRYDHRGFFAGTSHLARSAVARSTAVEAPFLNRSVAFGEEVRLPPTPSEPVWAKLDFRLTPLGHLGSALFKAPELLIDVTYQGGAARTYRIVAGEGSAGFLLSPTVGSARDFIALKLGVDDLLSDKVVRSFRMRQNFAYPLWGERFDATLSRLVVEADAADYDDLRGTAVLGPSLTSLPVAGECGLDSVAGRDAEQGLVRVSSASIAIEGWAMLSTTAKTENFGVRLALVDGAGRTSYAAGTKVKRRDLDKYFQLSSDARVAFSSPVDLRQLHGTFALSVVQDGPDGSVTCPTGVSISAP